METVWKPLPSASAAGWLNRGLTSRNSLDVDSFAHSFTEAAYARTPSTAA